MQRLKVFLLLAMWLLNSCEGPTLTMSPRQSAFATQVPFQVLPRLELTTRQLKKYGDGRYSVVMALDNESDEYIWFPNSRYGARSFIYSESEGRWIELQDWGEAPLDMEKVLAPLGKGDSFFDLIVVNPLLPPGVQPPVAIRVVVVGRIYREGRPTDQEVGTYVDITLPP